MLSDFSNTVRMFIQAGPIVFQNSTRMGYKTVRGKIDHLLVRVGCNTRLWINIRYFLPSTSMSYNQGRETVLTVIWGVLLCLGVNRKSPKSLKHVSMNYFGIVIKGTKI